MRCARCGNENSEQNRFCGMCGASLLAASAPKSAESQPVPVAASPSTAQVVAGPSQDSPRSVVERPSSISGPSFLGLSDPVSSKSVPRKRASLSIDPHSGAGSNLDYLLDEEEPQHHWGIGKILLILIALALAVGFGYLRFKNQGLAWLNGLKKPAAVAQNSPTPDAATEPASSPSITADPQPTPQTIAASPPQPATAAPANAPTGNSAAGPAPATSSPDNPPSTDTPKPTDAAPPTADADKAPDKATSPRTKIPRRQRFVHRKRHGARYSRCGDQACGEAEACAQSPDSKAERGKPAGCDLRSRHRGSEVSLRTWLPSGLRARSAPVEAGRESSQPESHDRNGGALFGRTVHPPRPSDGVSLVRARAAQRPRKHGGSSGFAEAVGRDDAAGTPAGHKAHSITATSRAYS